MVPSIRKAYNEAFTLERYEAFLQDLQSVHPGDIAFRVAETPVFIGKEFKAKVLQACEDIVDTIVRPDFNELTANAIPEQYRSGSDNERTDCIAFDFGICQSDDGSYSPQLIEMQGFPSLFAYQVLHSEIIQKHFPIPAAFDSYLNGLNKETYIQLLKEMIIQDFPPEEVILLEIYPEQQKTKIDFSCTKDYVGIETVCVTALRADGKSLYYEKADGSRQKISRIYNRVIFDDLEKQELPVGTIDLLADWNVSWCPHPNWFYRISKFTLPFIKSDYVPETHFLSDLDPVPANLEDWVLKPLFSFAGQGVIIDVTKADIDSIEDPQNWILQKKVTYANAILTPNDPAKAEIRIFYFWPKGAERPIPVQNLARLSKGKMIGVRYNADKDWVGGSLVFFEA
ncbi:MAG TPA: hypothetical protein VLC98_02060 [Phnomibacter sp.]|nr:hypothetical protein [Phnomibacter sp.]